MVLAAAGCSPPQSEPSGTSQAAPAPTQPTIEPTEPQPTIPDIDPTQQYVPGLSKEELMVCRLQILHQVVDLFQQLADLELLDEDYMEKATALQDEITRLQELDKQYLQDFLDASQEEAYRIYRNFIQ